MRILIAIGVLSAFIALADDDEAADEARRPDFRSQRIEEPEAETPRRVYFEALDLTVNSPKRSAADYEIIYDRKGNAIDYE